VKLLIEFLQQLKKVRTGCRHKVELLGTKISRGRRKTSVFVKDE
jgi:hypothetical protein